MAGTICREAAGSCDLPEYCTGASPYCPANVYLLDGSSCAYGEAYCNNGMCMTHHQQCVQLWGPGESRQPPCHPSPEQEPRWVSAVCLYVGSPWPLPVGLEGSGWRGCAVPIQGWGLRPWGWRGGLGVLCTHTLRCLVLCCAQPVYPLPMVPTPHTAHTLHTAPVLHMTPYAASDLHTVVHPTHYIWLQHCM